MKNRFLMWLAALMPKSLRYYAACRLFDEATEDLPNGWASREAYHMTYWDALTRWRTKNP